MTKYFRTASVLFIIVLYLGSCDLYSVLSGDDKTEISNITLTIDGSGLEEHDSIIELYEEGGSTPDSSVRHSGKNNHKGNKKNTDFALSYEARVIAPVIDGTTVQASDVLVHGNYIFVGYNTAGPVFKGALQVLYLSRRNVLYFLKEILLTDMEVFTLEADDTNLYIGGQANPDMYSSNRSFIATLELNNLDNYNSTNMTDSIIWLNSYANTGIASLDGKVFTGTGAIGRPGTSGTNGELVVINKDDDTSTSVAVDDVRDIEPYHSGVILIKGPVDGYDSAATPPGPTVGGNSQIQIWDSSDLSAPDKTIAIDGFVSAEHKASIEVYKNRYAFLGLSEAGFKMMDMKDVGSHDAEIVYDLANPETTGYITDTNSVSTDGKYIFTANGEYGFRVLTIEKMNGKNAEFASLEGFYPFEEDVHVVDGQYYSANHIDYKNNVLFVASGVGGVMVFVLND